MTEFNGDNPFGLPDDFDAELSAFMDAQLPDPVTLEYELRVNNYVGVVMGVIGAHNLVPEGMDLAGLTIGRLTDLMADPDHQVASFAARAVDLTDRLYYQSVADQYLDLDDNPAEDLVAESNYELIALLAHGDNPEAWFAVAEQLMGDIGLPTDPSDRKIKIDMATAWLDIRKSNDENEHAKTDEVARMLHGYMDKLGYGGHDDSASLMRSMLCQIDYLCYLEQSRIPGLDGEAIRQRIDNDELVRLNRENIKLYSGRIGADPEKIGLIISLLTAHKLDIDRA